MSRLVDGVCAMIDDTPSAALVLLIRARWQAKQLLERYLEDPSAVRRDAGLHPRSHPPFLRYDVFGADSKSSSSTSISEHGAKVPDNALVTKQATQEPQGLDCGICLCPMEQEEAFALCCEHWFCRDCWAGHIGSRIEGRAVTICCPATEPSKCAMAVPSLMVEHVCDAEVVKNFWGNVRR